MKESELFDISDELAYSFRRSAVLFAALELELFDTLRETPLSPGELGERIGAAPDRLRRLLDALTLLGFLRRNGGAYAVKDEWLRLTDPQREDNLQARYAHAAKLSRNWTRIADSLRADRRVRDLPESTLPENEDRIRAFHRSLGSRTHRLFSEIAESLAVKGPVRILDLGGGFGDACRPFLERDPKSTAVLFENAETIAQARPHMERLGFGGRMDYVAGDFLHDPLPAGFDLLIVSNILHIYGEATNLRLLEALHKAANPGGLLLARDITIDEDRTGPASGVLFALNMAINTDEGDAYPRSAVRRWLEQSGWSSPADIDTAEKGIYILRAVKEGD